MAINQLEREARKILSSTNEIAGEEAEILTRIILADNYISPLERRFVKSLLKRDVCDDRAFHKFVDLLSAGQADNTLSISSKTDGGGLRLDDGAAVLPVGKIDSLRGRL